MLKAAEVGGSVRVISKDTGQITNQSDDDTRKGVTQVRYKACFGKISKNCTYLENGIEFTQAH